MNNEVKTWDLLGRRTGTRSSTRWVDRRVRELNLRQVLAEREVAALERRLVELDRIGRDWPRMTDEEQAGACFTVDRMLGRG